MISFNPDVYAYDFIGEINRISIKNNNSVDFFTFFSGSFIDTCIYNIEIEG